MRTYPIKIFFVSLSITLVMTLPFFHTLRSLPGRLISPLQTARVDTLTPLLPRLAQHTNDYSLKKPFGFIPKAFAQTESDQATSYAVIDYDSGEIIAEKNGDQSVPMASLTKIMTAVVALDLASSNDQFDVNQVAASQIPTKIGVTVGQKLALHDLLQASLMTSANDATEVIRQGIDTKYSDSGLFVQAMNKKAEILGLKHTHFTNPQGFDDTAHYSSAEDLAVLSHYALSNYPLIAEIVQQDYVTLAANAEHTQFDLYNWNGLLGVYPNVFGVKIGNTDAAQKTMVVGAERNGHKILVVLLGAPDILHRDLWAAALLDEGFASSYGLPPIKVTTKNLQAKYATWK